MNAIYESYSGARIDLIAPDWRDVVLDDLARGLAQTSRFGGQTRRVISVAEHSLVVGLLAPPGARLAALLHDAHEAVLGDWTRPVTQALMLIGGSRARDALYVLKRRLDVCIARRLLEDADATPAMGREAEASALADEMAGLHVRQADDEALRLEMSIRLSPELSQGPTPTNSRARELYPSYAPAPFTVEHAWLSAVRDAAAQRYGART